MEPSGESLLSELERLSALREKGHISEEEFALTKSRLLMVTTPVERMTIRKRATYEYHTVVAECRDVDGDGSYQPTPQELTRYAVKWRRPAGSTSAMNLGPCP